MSDAEQHYEVVDPRAVARSARYTFYLLSLNTLRAIGENDLIQLIIRAIPKSKKWDAERMWMKVTKFNAETLEGILESVPDDMPKVPQGSLIRAPRTSVLDVIFDNPSVDPRARELAPRECWERCYVDQRILDRDLLAHYLRRETPQPQAKGDKYPDSGWRIRGDTRGATDAEIDKREVVYVALGAVLNADDSWLHLIDEPVGSEFERDFGTGKYRRLTTQ